MCKDCFSLILLHGLFYNILKCGRHATNHVFLWFGKQGFTEETNKLGVE